MKHLDSKRRHVRFSAKWMGKASLWGINAPKVARPSWWSSDCWLRLPAGHVRAAAGARLRRRSTGGGRKRGTHIGSPPGVRPEARTRGEWQEGKTLTPSLRA